MGYDVVVTTKRCSHCGEVKDVREFHKRKDTRDGFRADCKSCVRVRVSRNYFRDPSTKNDYDATRRNLPGKRVEAALRSAQWRAANPDKVAGHSAKYRAMKRSAFVEEVDPHQVLQEHGRWCYLCESPIGSDLHMDHVVPLSRGGLHCYENVRPTHATCNLSKNDRMLHELDLPFLPPKEGS